MGAKIPVTVQTQLRGRDAKGFAKSQMPFTWRLLSQIIQSEQVQSGMVVPAPALWWEDSLSWFAGCWGVGDTKISTKALKTKGSDGG